MTRTARRAAIAALTALAAVVAVIAADFTQPASAQSDDENAGRIVARLLEDGRVEFGWQPTSGERVLPRQRYFPPDAEIDKWLRSSPVEVGGAAIGRINVRLRSNGRIEFAFTPTDGERIMPPSRYFPADVRVGRWLRSTEITITPATPTGFSAVSRGGNHACAIRANNGAIECWGGNDWGQIDAPPGSYTTVSAGSSHTCAIHDTGAIACWGLNREGRTDAPEGSYTAVSAGKAHTCAIRDTGAIACWGSDRSYISRNQQEPEWEYTGQASPPPGNYTAVSAASWYTCAIQESSDAISCWGWDNAGLIDPPTGSFTAVSAGGEHACAIHDTGEIACWGVNYAGQSDAPAGSYTAVSTGAFHSCAIRDTGEIECWGNNEGFRRNQAGEWQTVEVGRTDAPAGVYTAVSVGLNGSCAIREGNGAIQCWPAGMPQPDAPTD